MKALLLLLSKLGSIAFTYAALTESTKTSTALPVIDLGYAIHRATVNKTGSYYNFSNIRYAAPPLGDLRFSAPVPPEHANRTINDGQQLAICPQANPFWALILEESLEGIDVSGINVSTLEADESAGYSNLKLSDIPKPGPSETEDCLFLDVIVPEETFDKTLTSSCGDTNKGSSVLVWIYGGGFVGGSKIDNNPAGLIARSRIESSEGIIFVAMNYRLGMFGWLSGPTFQETGTANAGLHDQRLALKWVKKYIHLFGGDPKRVTVMGESAGGASILHQITAYGGMAERAPFQQAIPQSPGWFPITSNYQKEIIFGNLLKYASYVSNSSITTLDQLRSLPSSVLQLANAIGVGLAQFGAFTYGPSVDGAFIPALPGELLLHGQYDHSLKVMVGHNSDEGYLFTPPYITNGTALDRVLKQTFPVAKAPVINYITDVLYPPIFNGSYPYTSEFTRAALIVSEAVFTCNTRYIDLALRNQTYAYYFMIPPGLHGEDLAYTFFNGDITSSDEGSPVNSTIALLFQDYITSFVMNGNPNTKVTPNFPMYGAKSTVLDVNISHPGHLQVDSVANSRCTWWQKSLYD